MKIYRLILSAALLGGTLFSCSNEIDLYPDDAPGMLYVLGCVDGTGALHQVKVRKLISGNLDASMMINDPTYYLPDPSITVYLQDYSGRIYPMEPVLYPPQTGGPFAQDRNLIYALSGFAPQPNMTCRLKIEDPSTGKMISAQTTLPKYPTTIGYPSAESVVKSKFTFTDSQRPFHISWTLAPACTWTISIKYVDFMLNGDSYCRKTTYCGPVHYGPHPVARVDFPLSYLWRIFNISIADDPQVEYRQFYRFDFSAWTGDTLLSDFLDVANRFDDNRKQYFNNIEGGMGLFFSTSHAERRDVNPLETFHSSLSVNDSVRHLKFVRFPYSGIYTDPDSSLVNPLLNILR